MFAAKKPVLIAAACFTAVLLGSCNSSSSGGSSSDSLLRAVSSDAEFVDAFTSAYTRTIAPQDFVAEANADAGSGSSTGFTTTYTQEADVDEYDLVKYNGEHLFIAPSLQTACCFILAEAAPDFAPPQPEPVDRHIRVLATDTDNASATEISTIAVADGDYVQGLYIVDSRLLVLTTSGYYGTYGSVWLDARSWVQQSVNLQSYDISDAFNPRLEWTASLEGGFVDSRRVGNTLYLVSRYTPYFDDVVYYPASEQQASSNAQALATLRSDDIIPRISVDGNSTALFQAEDCFISSSSTERGHQTLTTITAIPIDNPDGKQSRCYNESSTGLYMSGNALYLSDVRAGENGGSTRIHKFSLNDLDYRGSAEVRGYLWNWGQRDFRISEHDGLLRLVTTELTGDTDDSRDHHLYLLDESPAGKSLQTVSQLPNQQRPTEIGEANEDLYGVRFIEDRAYLVSFEQIDPLIIINLSDATDPYIQGELEVPGFSDFLHPIGDSLLLGLGRSDLSDNRVKVELFDVSVPELPRSLGSSLIGEEGGSSWSEAQYNRHAFSYLASGGSTDRFTVPASSSWQDSNGDYQREDALHLFEVQGIDQPQSASLQPTGKISASPEPAVDFWYPSRHRSVLHNDAVFYILDDYVWSALWSDSDNQQGPQ